MIDNIKLTQKTIGPSGLLRHIRPGNGAGLFSKEKIGLSKRGDKQGRSEEKKISGESYDVNKQTIYIAPKSKHRIKGTLPEPARGTV